MNRTHLHLVLAILAIAALASHGFAQDAKAPIVSEVCVHGNRDIPTAKVMRSIRTKPGEAFSTQVASEDVSRLAATHLFKSIKSVQTEPLADGRLRVIFEVREHPNTVRAVTYQHAPHVRIQEIEILSRVKVGNPLDKDLNRLACFEILEHLQSQGYRFANVTLEEGFQDWHDRVVFNVMEGPQVRVRDVRFFSRDKLALGAALPKQIDTHKGALYQPDRVFHDVNVLTEYYRSRGYLAAHVARELNFSDDFAFADIVFHIHEGQRSRVGAWRLQADNPVLAAQLKPLIKVKRGAYYSQSAIDSDVKALSDWAGWRGKRLNVQPVITEFPDQPGTLLVQYQVEDAPVSYVGEVIIVGNTVTQDKVIRKAIGLYPGQILSYPEVRLSERRLAKLKIFEIQPEAGVQPTVTVLDSPSKFKDILVKVQETRTGTLTLGIGVNSRTGLTGHLSVTERNFDPRRWPRSLADLYDGRAFRGGGEYLKVQLLPTVKVERRAN